MLCGEILLENGIRFHEVSYERRPAPLAASVQLNRKKNFGLVLS
jgi:hypothetical protein